MAGSVLQEALPHKAPNPVTTDWLEPYRQQAISSYQWMVKEGKAPQYAAMEVLGAAQNTGNEEIIQAVLEVSNRFHEGIDTAQ